MRTEPRTFKFKSRHLPDERPEWDERKRRVEEDVFGASQDAPRPIRFRQGGKSFEVRAERRAASVHASRMAALRAAGVALVLVYLTYRAILWIETQDYGGFLQFMKANG